jgi:FMN phosphatase YigB (HAD superfamily)
VALRAVIFDVGETLVDEERWWRELCRRVGMQPHVVWAALGVAIERGGRFFERVVELAGCAPGEVAYVGDRDDNDVLPAAAAGLVAVHVRRGPWGLLQPSPAEAALVLDDLASLPQALASLP